MALFTPEELEELRRADEELEASFRQTQEEIQESRQRDRQARLDGLDNKARQVAAQKKAYYEANRDKVAAQKKAWQRSNREQWNAYQREYRRRRNSAKAASCPAV